MKGRLPNLLMVTVIAVLIWVYAASQTIERAEVFVSVDFIAPAGQDLLIEEQGPRQQVRLVLEGNQAELARFRRLDQPLQIEVRQEPGETQMPVAVSDVIRNLQAVRNTNVSIVESRPDRIQLHVEPFVTLDNISISTSELPESVVISDVTPTTATLRFPASSLETVNKYAEIEAQISEDVFGRLEPGVRSPISAAVTLPPELAAIRHLSIVTPRDVKAVLTLQVERIEGTPRVPVKVMMSPTEAGRFLIDVDESFVDITLSGPRDVMTQLENSNELFAVVDLSGVDLDARIDRENLASAVLINLPDGVIPGLAPSVTYRVRRIEAAALPSTGPLPE